MEINQKRVLSHLAGPIWEEFESRFYCNSVIDDHNLLISEVFTLHEIAEEHLNMNFPIPKPR